MVIVLNGKLLIRVEDKPEELISQLLTTYQPEDASDRHHEDGAAYANDNEE